jgi:hypothetical protein
MKKFQETSKATNARQLVSFSLAFGIVGAGLLCVPMSYGQAIPRDAKPLSAVDPATFKSWFKGGTPTLDGLVNPADSLAFSPSSNGSFYQWSWQMFLWLTSPDPSQPGGGSGRIFESPTFFDVSDTTGDGTFTLTRHSTTGNAPPLLFAVRADQVGPDGLPTIRDRFGRRFDVVPTPVGTPRLLQPTVLDAFGKKVKFSHVEISDNKARFMDLQGNPIPKARPELVQGTHKLPVVEKFIVGNRALFVDAFGDTIETGPGQADGGVLIGQSRVPVYFSIVVNDVYAFYLTQKKLAGIANVDQFPSTQAELNDVAAFAQSKGQPLDDPNALAIEMKLAWVDTANLTNPGDYIQVKADIPVYTETTTSDWKTTTTKHATLALVGVHVVGSTAGQGEMIWSTFEHVGNTPNDAFQYLLNSGGTKTVARDTAGPWLFCKSGATDHFNEKTQIFDRTSKDIKAIGGASPTIQPTNAIRFMPWGAASSGNTAGFDPVKSNTEIVSANGSVIDQLIGGDVRKNYFLVGATWTSDGSVNGSEVGTNQLANSTMETFIPQSSAFDPNSTNCFFCHGSGNLSHIFRPTKPLQFP